MIALGLIEERHDETLIISKTPLKSVVKVLEERLDVPLKRVGGGDADDPEDTAIYAGTDPVGLMAAFESLVTEGFFLARGTPRMVSKVEEPVGNFDDMFIDLDLAAW